MGLAVMVALAALVAPHGGTGTADLLPGFQTAFFGAAVAAFLGTAATVVLVQRPPPASVHNKALLAWSLTFQCTAAIDQVPNVLPVKQAEPHSATLECSTSTMTAKTLDAIRSPGPFRPSEWRGIIGRPRSASCKYLSGIVLQHE